jgi:hypothetical protein
VREKDAGQGPEQRKGRRSRGQRSGGTERRRRKMRRGGGNGRPGGGGGAQVGLRSSGRGF